jgi:TATA-box binding protein (TBP) (component of TFIID and TFIIIB)
MNTVEYIKDVYTTRNTQVDKPSYLRITTITMTGREICGEVNANNVREAFRELGGVFKICPENSTIGHTWTLQPTKKGKQFYNCVYIGYRDAYSTKHVKLFKNGSIQIAGCSDIYDCEKVVRQLKLILPRILKKDIDIEFEDFDIQMINGSFNISRKIHLFNLFRILKENPEYDVQYDPDSYHALSLRFEPEEGMKKLYAKVFTTGSVQISGAKTIMECARAYQVINRLIEEKCRVGDPVEKDQKNMIFGHHFEDWMDFF